ncbi:MAG: alpha-galactosidase [Lachnospiraceae bacterium]|nr:alpha-galactosidase [Lachnospiraceae bacterium]
MGIIFNEKSGEFHLYNENISYLMKILRNGQIGQLYFGSRIPQKEHYDYLLENAYRPMSAYVYENEYSFSLEHLKQEYPSYGSSDFRMPAFTLKQENGSSVTAFQYVSHKIYAGKPVLSGLPATYTEKEDEADTLEILLRDELLGTEMTLIYTIFNQENAVARSVRFENRGEVSCQLDTAMSLCLDLPDADYEWVQFSGAWARERYVKNRMLQQGIQSVGSTRGSSGHMHNPFVVLKRPAADEFQGEVMGFSLVYSGNFLAQAEVDTYNVTRMMMGIHPLGFSWCLEPGESFQTPEAVIVYSKEGMNGMSQTFHKLYRTRLARGEWRDKERPVLLNNWEATYFNFDEEKLVQIAKTAKEDGVELFVLDDGWFSTRCGETSGLGDWWANTDRLPNGIKGLSERIEELGLKFGLWFELEMVNKDSELYRNHPDWIIHTPGRTASHGRKQYVLDFSRKEVVDYIFNLVAKILRESKVSYIKWDMNRSITECFSEGYGAKRQGEIFHRYILGVYDLYERLIAEFPHILFESCASGGGRFDAGMLYYAPQAWTSDDTDAVERVKIQYGTSYAYPLSSMGAHVSITPNHQLCRETPIKMRGDVACFGAFGYELDLAKLTAEERRVVRKQIEFVKQYRGMIHRGSFYRLQSPFENNISAWMVVSEDKKQAIVVYIKILNDVNCEFRRLHLKGLDENFCYHAVEDDVEKGDFFGSELMNIGMITSDASAGQALENGDLDICTDFWSKMVILKAE